MTENQILANNRKMDHPTCIYRCPGGCVHVFYGYVNIGMTVANFRHFAKAIRELFERIQKEERDEPHIAIRYCCASLVIPVQEFVDFALTVHRAGEALSLEESLHNGEGPACNLPEEFACEPVRSFGRAEPN